MPDTPADPVPYHVTYSEDVRTALRTLILHAKAKGLARQVLVALKEIDHRLHVYPQFGQPLRDLLLEPVRLWIGVVPPLVVRYLLDEEHRLVIVAVPILPLPKSGL